MDLSTSARRDPAERRPSRPAAGRATEPPAGARPAPTLARRAVLAAAAGGTLLVAGCATGGSGDDGSSASSTSGSADDASSAPSASSASSAAGSSAAGSSVVSLADVPVGGAVAAKAGGEPIIVAQPTAGSVKAFSAICTHQGCTVVVKGVELDCPCHGSVFNALTGAVERGPAPTALPAVAVHVDGADVVAGA